VDLSEGTHLTGRRAASALTRGGVRLSQAHRRSVYGFVDRADLMEMMSVFDFASPDLPTGRRHQTAVPQQALFLMNSPLVIEQAANVVARPDFRAQADDEARIRFLYELFYQRPPNAAELELGRSFVTLKPAASPPTSPATGATRRDRPDDRRAPGGTARPMDAWTEYAHALLMTDEFCFVD
jgi:hypothetical protein